MNKKIKKTIIYTLAAGVVGGITAGIAVPITLASNKVNNLNPLPGMGEKTKILGNITANDLVAETVDAGIDDSTLLNKAEYTTAFYLYEKEQKASIDMQKLYFRFEQYQTLNRMFKTLGGNSFDKNGKVAQDPKFSFTGHNDLKLSPDDGVDLLIFNQALLKDESGIQVPNYDSYQAAYDSLIAQINVNLTNIQKEDKLKSRYDNLKASLESFQKIWADANTGYVGKLEKLDKGFSDADYEAGDFTSRFPKVLKIVGDLKGDVGSWSGTGIYGDQASIFMDERNQVVSQAASEEEGEANWAKDLSKKYNGATTEEEAIKYKVFTQINAKAFARNKFEINNTFSVDHMISRVFNPIIGTVDANGFEYDTTENKFKYLKTKLTNVKISISEKNVASGKTDEFFVNRTDHVYFFGTKSLDINLLNPGLARLPDLFDDRKMMSIQNAVIGFKQGTSVLEGWSIGKDLAASKQTLKNYFYVREDATTASGDTHLNADAFEELFKDTSDEEKWLTKELIAKYTETKDSTQWKSGNLGYMEGIKATSMAPGFGLGMLAVYDKLENDGTPKKPYWFDQSKSIIDKSTILKTIRDELVKAFLVAAEKEGLAILGKNPGDKIDNTIFTKKNQDSIDLFIDSLSESQIKEYFGIAIRNVFGTDEMGIGQVYQIDIDKKAHTGRFVFYSPDFGLHIVRINTGSFTAIKDIKNDLQEVANDQDIKSSITDYGTLYTNNYPIVDQISKLLNDDPAAPNDEYHKYLNDNIKNYKKKGKTISTDVTNLVDSLMKAAKIDKVQKSGWSKLSDYLIKQFDGKLIDQAKSLEPEKIYEAILGMSENSTTTNGGTK